MRSSQLEHRLYLRGDHGESRRQHRLRIPIQRSPGMKAERHGTAGLDVLRACTEEKNASRHGVVLRNIRELPRS